MPVLCLVSAGRLVSTQSSHLSTWHCCTLFTFEALSPPRYSASASSQLEARELQRSSQVVLPDTLNGQSYSSSPWGRGIYRLSWVLGTLVSFILRSLSLSGISRDPAKPQWLGMGSRPLSRNLLVASSLRLLSDTASSQFKFYLPWGQRRVCNYGCGLPKLSSGSHICLSLVLGILLNHPSPKGINTESLLCFLNWSQSNRKYGEKSCQHIKIVSHGIF